MISDGFTLELFSPRPKRALKWFWCQLTCELTNKSTTNQYQPLLLTFNFHSLGESWLTSVESSMNFPVLIAWNHLMTEVSCDHLKQESFGLKFQEDRGDFLQQRCGRPGTQVGHSAPVHRHQIHRGPELNPPGLRVEHLSQWLSVLFGENMFWAQQAGWEWEAGESPLVATL